MRTVPRVPRADDGSTLLEVLVALAVVTIAMAGLGSFFIGGNRIVAEERDERQAVQVAAAGIELVRGLEGSSLLSKRGQATVQKQWDDGLTGQYHKKLKPYLNSMSMAYDGEAATTSGDDAPIPTAPRTVTVGRAVFERSMFVGRCEVYFMRNDDCVNPSGVTAPSNKAEILKYFRVVVLISWTGKNCSGGRCSHIASTLVSSEKDPEFNSNTAVPELVTAELVFYAGREKTYRLDADGGQQPSTWTIASRPSWLTAPTAVGYVTGTPTTAGVTNTTVRVTDALGRWDEGPLKLTVVVPPALTVPSPSRSVVNTNVTLNLATTGGVPSYLYSSSDLPDELALNPGTGVLTGRFTTAGTYTFSVTVQDANGVTDKKTITHVVYQPLTLGVIPAQKAQLGAPVTVTAVAAGGCGQVTYTLANAPAGVTINAVTGVISGTPPAAGRYVPTVTVTDEAGGLVKRTFELVVETTTNLTFTSPNPAGADRTAPANQAITNLVLGTNADLLGLKNVKFDVTGLPAGLKLNNGKDAILGTPTTPGTYLVKVIAEASGQTAELNFVWTIT